MWGGSGYDGDAVKAGGVCLGGRVVEDEQVGRGDEIGERHPSGIIQVVFIFDAVIEVGLGHKA
jgi:hypothetical protein